MTAHKNRPSNPDSGTMLNQKTNEDFNKKKPNPTDPNEQKGRVTTAIPVLGGDDGYPLEPASPDEMGRWEKAPATSNGSE